MGIFHHSGSSNHTCPMPSDLSSGGTKPIVADMDFHKLNTIVSGACTAFVFLVIFILMFMHTTHFSSPLRQVRILRISALLPLYTLFSFLGVAFPNSYVYFMPWPDVFQAIALLSFFLLLCDFISPNDQERMMFIGSLNPQMRKGSKKTTDGISWFRQKWIGVVQYPLVATLVAIVTCITESQDIYCLESNKAYFAHLWLNIIGIISVVVAVMNVIGFYIVLKAKLKPFKALTKLLAFKLIVGVVFIEKIVFMILRSTNALQPSSTLTYSDVHIGIQAMIICLQMVPFAVFFHIAYGIGPYKINRHQLTDGSPNKLPARYHGGPLGLRAWVMLVNPLEIMRDVQHTFGLIRMGQNGAFRGAPMGY